MVDVDSEPTGRRSSRADLGDSGGAAQVVVDEWSAARLLTLDHDPRTRVPTVQVAHEALLRTWPRLRQWITEDRDTIAERHHVREAAAEWQRMDRDEAGLYRGVRLDAALAALDDSPMPPLETEFLDASRAFRAREELEAQERIDRQARANRRLRAQLAAIAVALVVALIVGFVALDQRGQAQAQRDAADAARRDATARELAAAADANIDIDPERSMLLGLRAVDTTKSVDGTVLPVALDALHRAVSETRLLATAPDTGGRLAWDPAGDTFVTEGPEESGIVDIRSATTGESVRSWRGDDVDINDVAYSADGTMLAVAGDDGVLKVFDPSDGSLISTVQGSGPVWSPSFSADGTRLLAQWIQEEKVRTVDPATGETLAEADDVFFRMDISPDGRRVIAGTFDEPYAAIFDTGSAEPAVVPTESVKSSDWSWSHSGTMVAGGGDDGVVRILDAQTGELLASASGHGGPILSIDWSFDDGRLATGSADGTAKVWRFDGSTLSEEFRLSADDLAAGVAGVSFSPDGNRLAVGDVGVASTKIFDVSELGGGELFNLEAAPSTGGAITADQVVTVGSDGFVRTTDLATGRELRRLEEPEVGGFRGLAAVDPSGTRIAVQPFDGSSQEDADEVEIRDLADGGLRARLDVSDGAVISAMAWSPDGSRVVLAQEPDASDGAQIVVHDAETGARLSTLALPALWVDSVAVAPDGTRVAFAQSNRPRSDPTRDVVKIWDWERNDVVAEIPVAATHLAFDPDGTHVALTRTNDGRAEVVETDTGAIVATLSGSTSPLNAVTFTADGASVVTGGQDGTVRLWDSRTGDEQLLLDAEHAVLTVGVDPSGTRLLSLDDSGLARVWALDPDELVSIAQSKLTRALTDAECERYISDGDCAEPDAS